MSKLIVNLVQWLVSLIGVRDDQTAITLGVVAEMTLVKITEYVIDRDIRKHHPNAARASIKAHPHPINGFVDVWLYNGENVPIEESEDFLIAKATWDNEIMSLLNYTEWRRNS